MNASKGESSRYGGKFGAKTGAIFAVVVSLGKFRAAEAAAAAAFWISFEKCCAAAAAVRHYQFA